MYLKYNYFDKNIILTYKYDVFVNAPMTQKKVLYSRCFYKHYKDIIPMYVFMEKKKNNDPSVQSIF